MRNYQVRKINVTDLKNGEYNYLPSSTLCQLRKRYGIKVSKWHPKKEEILQAIIDGMSWLKLVKTFKISKSTVSRYKAMLR